MTELELPPICLFVGALSLTYKSLTYNYLRKIINMWIYIDLYICLYT